MIKKLLITMTILVVGLLLAEGLHNKESMIMWMAATSMEYAYVRAALIVVLLTLLISSPPRSLFFRFILAGLAIILGAATVGLSYTYAMNLLDAVVFIEIAIIFMIEAVEGDRFRMLRIPARAPMMNTRLRS